MDFLAQEFLQDFLDESDQHLRIISEHLLHIEQSGQQPDSNAVDALFRAFHTLKGLCGMVGLSQASELAHRMESLLRVVRKGERDLAPPAVEALLDGVQLLQGLIEPLRTPDAPQPDPAAVLERLQALLGLPAEREREPAPLLLEADEGESPALPSAAPAQAPVSAEKPVEVPLPEEVLTHLQPEDLRRVQQAVQRGWHLRVAYFQPDVQRAAEGVDVNHVRSALQALGELIKGVPIIEQGQVRFAFLLACEQPPDAEAVPAVEWLTPQAAPAAAAQRQSRPRLAPSLRVEVSRLDEILQLVGELVVTRNRLHILMRQMPPGPAREAFLEIGHRLERQMRALRRAVMRTRMVPLSEVFGRMPLAVRDLARREGKQVRLVLEGEHIEIDKSMVERLLDPLLHMARNAVTHGLETPEERLAAGKAPQGTLTVRAESAGERIIIHVQDDGRGVDLEQVAAKACERGLLDEMRPISAKEALHFIAHPGFSTRTQADLGAGRGVGMDVVMNAVAAWNGAVHMSTQPGSGTTFSMYLPLSLTIFEALLVGVGAERYAIPRDSISRIFSLDEDKISRLEGREWYPLGDAAAQVSRLRDLFAVPQPRQSGSPLGLLMASPRQPVVLVVDRVLGMSEVVMHAIHDPLIATPAVAGATELGDGSVILVLDSDALVRLAQGGL